MGTFKVSLHSLFSNSQTWVLSSHLSSSAQRSFERFSIYEFIHRFSSVYPNRVKTSTEEEKEHKPPVQQR
ncbi:hypothetical protein PRUPE_5G012200 [Prunus persica]|uniref:Uncharacterized protein n=1 Tax=Prunus persica TaxID=3760 RepID=A0A251P1W8_PRUPE|nr:hypothetical protein PRUPE_5G012200 [Prunus persica]